MRRCLPWFCAALLFAACRDEKITAYRVPKEASPPPAAPVKADAQTPGITWATPAGWAAQPDKSGMRKGSFLVSGANGASADMSITVFPGDVGGDLANVNRWRNQVGLAPIDNAALAQTVQTLDAPAGKFLFVDLVGENASGGAKKSTRLLGAWLKQPERTWFFKLMGDDALVAAQSDVFAGFLKSVAFQEAAPAGAPLLAGQVQAQSTNDLPKNTGAPFAPFAGGAMPAPDTNAAPAATSGASLTWTAPADWQAKPSGQMRLGSFDVRGADGATADVSISAFPGEVGGLLANVNRWRGQLGLAPIAEADLAGVTSTFDGAGGLHFTVVDFAGQSGGAPARMLGAIAPFGGQTYFFKMLGPDALVAGRKAAFLDFLKTVKAP